MRKIRIGQKGDAELKCCGHYCSDQNSDAICCSCELLQSKGEFPQTLCWICAKRIWQDLTKAEATK